MQQSTQVKRAVRSKKTVAVQAKERTDEPVVQYISLDSWFFWTIVEERKKTGRAIISPETCLSPIQLEAFPPFKEGLRAPTLAQSSKRFIIVLSASVFVS